jgi:dipeptidyl aminopeptidase/acylaminoacyl peptidase
MRAWLPVFVLVLVAAHVAGVASAAHTPAGHSFGFDDLARLKRLGGFDVARDGKSLVYSVTSADVDENKTTSALYWQAIDGKSPARQLTAGTKKDRDPRLSPDGTRVAFISDRDGAPEVYLLDLGGGEPRKLTSFPLGADGPIWSPDGTFLVAAAEVFADCKDLACDKARLEREEKAKVKARVVERLLFRHWDGWRDGKRSHLFRIDARSGDARDLTPGNFDTPPFSLGGGGGYDIAPDGKTLVYASNHDKDEATSTNGDIWELAFGDGQRAPRCLSCANRAFDGEPRYSPDGKRIAWTAQTVPSFESDKFDLVVYDRAAQTSKRLTASFDDWVEEPTWTADSQRVVFGAVHLGRKLVYAIDLDGKLTPLRDGTSSAAATPLPDGTLVYAASSLTRAPELFHDGKALTHLNDYGALHFGDVRERWVTLSDGKKEQAWMVTPPGFDAKKKYPALFWVHGGPQGAFEDQWSWRWNPEVLASAGYVVYMPNPRGSTGYGQAYVNGVSQQWGGQVYDDLMRAADDLSSLPFVDKTRIGAAGASFGGFMMNWFQGHTRRFAALFCHAGIADQAGQYATEELWFAEHEFGGLPWQSDLYRKWNPMDAAKDFKTPEMVVHGERDYRIPVEQGYLMFTLLQRMGVPSKLLVFPDENHWVLKPANSRLWYASMIDWFHRWLGGAPADQRALDSAFSVTR